MKIRGLIGLQDSYQDRLVLFNVHMYDEFHVPDVLIVLPNSQGYWFKQSNLPFKLSLCNFPKLYPATLKAHPCCTSHLLDLLCCCCLKFWIRLHNTILVDCLFSRNDFDCSVIHTWGTDWRSHRAANVPRTPSRKWELNSNWLTAGKECGSILRSRLWEGELRDDTKNGCVAD